MLHNPRWVLLLVQEVPDSPTVLAAAADRLHYHLMLVAPYPTCRGVWTDIHVVGPWARRGWSYEAE